MPNTFDEIRNEIEKQKANREQWEQAHRIASEKFAKQVAQYSSMVDSILDEFGIALFGNTTSIERGFLGFETKRQVKAFQVAPLTINSYSKDFCAEAGVGYFFIRINGNDKGDISSFSVGRRSTDEWEGESVDTNLPPSPTRQNLEEALVKSYQKRPPPIR